MYVETVLKRLAPTTFSGDGAAMYAEFWADGVPALYGGFERLELTEKLKEIQRLAQSRGYFTRIDVALNDCITFRCKY